MAKGCYTPKFLPASFKGFPFDAVQVESSHGRRGAKGEFPFGEETAYQDMGRKIRTYHLTARFVENDHVAQASAFISVLESKGPGALVHPTRGVVQAACESAKVKDEILEGYGITIVDLEFVEANDQGQGGGGGSSGTTNLYGVPIAGFTAAVGTHFKSSYQLAATPFYEREPILLSASKVVGAIKSQLSLISGDSTQNALWTQVANLTRVSNNQEAARNGETLWTTISQGLAAIDRYGSDAKTKFNAFRVVANSAAKVSALSSTAGRRTQNAVYAGTRLASSAYMARAASQIRVRLIGDAFVRIDAISALLDQEKEQARLDCSPSFYLQIRDFEVSTQAQLVAIAVHAPPRVVYDFHGPVSSIVAAYRIYGDSKRFRDVEFANPAMPPFAMGPEIIAVKAAA